MLVKFWVVELITRFLPVIVIGPMIIVVGLGLANSAVTNAGFVKMVIEVILRSRNILITFINKERLLSKPSDLIRDYRSEYRHLLGLVDYRKSSVTDCVTGIILPSDEIDLSINITYTESGRFYQLRS